MSAMSERIRKARKDKNLTLAQLGSIIGVSVQAAQKWENTKLDIAPRHDKLLKIAEALEVSPIWLQYGDEAGKINNPNYGTIGSQTNITGGQTTYTNNFLTDTSTEQAQAQLGQVPFLVAMPLLGIDDGVLYALNKEETLIKIKDIAERAATFIPHSDMTFGVKIADDSLKSITQQYIQEKDILIVEPRIEPRNQDLVLLCLDYKKSKQRGMFARILLSPMDNEYKIQYSDSEFPDTPRITTLPENALICGVVVEVKRRLIPNDIVSSRIDVNYNILNTLKTSSQEVQEVQDENR